MPFLPVAGFQGSDLPEALGWKTVLDPYGGDELYAVPRLQPDWAVIHVPEADAEGNARIYGTPFWDRLMSRGARRVIVTAETIVTREHLAHQPELTVIPELFVEAVVQAPGGAWPGSCHPLYGVDYAAAEAYASMPIDAESLARHLEQTARRLRAINIAGGINPTPRHLPRSTTDPELTFGSAALLSNEEIYDLCMRGGLDTVFLGAAQVDGSGRTNVSRIGPAEQPKVKLPGGGGAAVMMPTARRVILSRAEHSRRSFVERLDVVTGAGNVDRVVTSRCIFRRVDGRLQVESVHPSSSPDEVVENTGFVLDRTAPWPETPPPTPAEMEALQSVDPERVRDLEQR